MWLVPDLSVITPSEVGGATCLSFSLGNVLRFPSCSWMCPVSDSWTLTWAWYYSLHFVKLYQIEHILSPASCFTLILHRRTSCLFCTLSHLICLLIPFGVTLSPPCRLFLVHHHPHALLSDFLDKAPAPPVCTPMFFLKNKAWKMEERRLPLCVVSFSFIYFFFSIWHFVYQEQNVKMWLIKIM